MDEQQKRLTEFLNEHVRLPRRVGRPPFAWRPEANRPSAEQLAAQLIALAEFRALGLASAACRALQRTVLLCAFVRSGGRRSIATVHLFHGRGALRACQTFGDRDCC